MVPDSAPQCMRNDAQFGDEVAAAPTTTPLDTARWCHDRDIYCIPVPRGEKGPTQRGWQNERLGEFDIDAKFDGDTNIGVLLGEPSGWLIDIDLDAMAAVAIAAQHLPHTECIFGRASKRRSHWLYRARGPLDTKKWRFPSRVDAAGKKISGESVVELRSTGLQTVAPGSVHPSGEAIEWDSQGDPAPIDSGTLYAAVEALARAAGAEVTPGARVAAATAATAGQACHTTATPEGWTPAMKACRRLMAQLDDSESGQRGSDPMFSAACLVAEFNLPENESDSVIAWFNETKCKPKWSAAEIAHKLENARTRVADQGKIGSRHPEELLDPKQPLETARLILAANRGEDDVDTIRRYADRFYRWAGSAYRELEEDEIRRSVYRFCEPKKVIQIQRGAERVEPFAPNQKKIGEIVDAMRSECLIPHRGFTPPEWLDRTGGPAPAPHELLVCRNGSVHLPTFIAGGSYLTPPTPRFFNFSALDYAFNPSAPVPTHWLTFLASLWEDAESIALLQEWFGYCLTADTQQQKIMLLYGPKRSGKGTIAEVLGALIGKENVAGPTLHSLTMNFGLWPLIGKSLAIVGDARLSAHGDRSIITERLLSISGGDALTLDRKNMQPLTLRLGTRIMLLTNELPKLSDASGALASRFLILRLTQSFYGHEDKTLGARLLTELPGILLWAVEGWARLRAQGRFSEPAANEEVTRELESLGSPVIAFVDECCVTGGGCQVPTAELYRCWTAWCAAQGMPHPGSDADFGRDLTAAFPSVRTTRKRVGGQRTYFRTGIAIRANRPTPDLDPENEGCPGWPGVSRDISHTSSFMRAIAPSNEEENSLPSRAMDNTPGQPGTPGQLHATIAATPPANEFDTPKWDQPPAPAAAPARTTPHPNGSFSTENSDPEADPFGPPQYGLAPRRPRRPYHVAGEVAEMRSAAMRRASLEDRDRLLTARRNAGMMN
jgi:putative DNA primase/helicase